MARLPLELVHSIIEFLADDWETLSICSIVHSSWTDGARKAIFSRCNVRVGYIRDIYPKRVGWKSTGDFVAMMAKYPNLPKHIHNLRIDLAAMHRVFVKTHSAHETWQLEDIFGVILDAKLSCLETLNIYGPQKKNRSQTYLEQHRVMMPVAETFSPELRMKLSSLTSLDFDVPLLFPNLSSLKAILCSLGNLKRLSYNCLDFHDPSNSPACADATPSLQHLRSGYDTRAYYSQDDCFLDWLISTSTVQSMEEMIVFYKRYTPALGRLWQSIKRSFVVDMYIPALETIQEQCHWSHLQTLRLRVFAGDTTSEIIKNDFIDLYRFTHLCQFLSLPSLQTIYFDFPVDPLYHVATLISSQPVPALSSRMPCLANIIVDLGWPKSKKKVQELHGCRILRHAFSAIVDLQIETIPPHIVIDDQTH